MTDLVNYKPTDYPQIPNAEPQYFTREFRNIGVAINSIEAQFPVTPQGYISGLQLSNSGTTTLNISAGVGRDSTNEAEISVPAFTKSISGAFVAGSGQNGMGTGLTAAASTWYHVFAIVYKSEPDIYFDTSATGTHAPVGTSALRRIGSFLTDGSVHIVPFSQNGDEFLWTAQVLDVSSAAIPAARANVGLSVPTGVQVWAQFMALVVNLSTTTQMYTGFCSPDQGGTVANYGSGSIAWFAYNFTPPTYAGMALTMRTNTAAQISIVPWPGAVMGNYYIQTSGWIDRRGRDA